MRRMRDGGALFPPPPCGEGSGVGVVPDEAEKATSLDAQPWRSFLNQPHPHPPRKGEWAKTSRSAVDLRGAPA